jgi:hypothetical protein
MTYDLKELDLRLEKCKNTAFSVDERLIAGDQFRCLLALWWPSIKRDLERYRWVLPILLQAGTEGDRRAILLARCLVQGLLGEAAIDAAMKGDSNG